MKNRNGFTLIELIFSIVIIGIAFTVFPKILQLASKTSVQNLKEEAMYNAVAYIGLIKSTAWDENNTLVDDILHVSSDGDAGYDCNSSSGYRIGGFNGSRNCKNDKSASFLGRDENDSYDDIDDFNDANASNEGDSREYNLSVKVAYVKDINSSTDDNNFSNENKSNSTNTKRVSVTVNTKKKASALGNAFVKVSYSSENIGQLKINRRSWQ